MTVLWHAAHLGGSFFCRTILRNVFCFVLLCIQQKFSKEVLYGANGKPLYAFYGVNDGPGKLCVHSSIRARMRAECMCVNAFSRVVLHAHTQLSRSPLHPSLFLSLTHTMYAYFEINGKTLPASYMLHAANTENVLFYVSKKKTILKNRSSARRIILGGDFLKKGKFEKKKRELHLTT